MLTVWTQHITDTKEREAFENAVKGSKPVLDRLQKILTQDYASVEMAEMDIKSYDTPGWDYKQAHRNGFKACLNKYKYLLTTEDK